MLNNLSWPHYLTAMLVLLAIYYLVIGLKYYHPELRHIFNKYFKRDISQHRLPEALIYEEPEALPAQNAAPLAGDVEYLAEADDLMDKTEEFIGRFKKVTAQAATKTYSPTLLIHSLQLLFTEYPQIKNSPHRAAISELIASECEQTGTAQLSEDEVDAWWDEFSAVPAPGPSSTQVNT